MAFCANCGTELSDQAPSCPKCGHPRFTGPGRRTESGAIVSLVLGILGIIACPLVLSIPAVIVGNRARATIRENPELEGDPMARAGVILGWIGIALAGVGIAIGVIALVIGLSSGYSDFDTALKMVS